MIRFKSIYIKNFKKFFNESIEIDFEAKDVVLIVKANGFGKTTILDALTFLFTGKMYNGSVSGYHSLDENNVDLNLKPHISLVLEIDKKEHKVEMINGFRYIDEVKFKSKEVFDNYLNTHFNIQVETVLNIVNPFYLMENMNTKQKRQLFLNIFANDEKLKKKTIDVFKNNTFDYDSQLVSKIIDQTKTFDTITLLNNYLQKLKTEQQNLFVKEQLFEQFKVNYKLNEDEERELEGYLEKNNVLKEFDSKIDSLKKQIFLSDNNKCSYCHSEIKDPKTIEENNKNKAILNDLTSERESIKALINYENFDALKRKKELSLNLEKTNIDVLTREIESTKNEIEFNTQALNCIKIYQKTEIECLNERLDEFPFKLKLFHKTQSDSYQEVFSILHNGVDYNYLNWAQRLLIGVVLTNFLYKSELPLLVDNADLIDEQNTNLLLESLNHRQLITTHVKR